MSSSNKSFTPRELELAGLVWQCLKTDPQIDFDKLAKVAKFKNKASAAACWAPIKKKLAAHASGDDNDEATPATPVDSGFKAKKTTASTSGKKGKATGSGKRKAVKAAEEEMQESPTIKKMRNAEDLTLPEPKSNLNMDPEDEGEDLNEEQEEDEYSSGIYKSIFGDGSLAAGEV